jgi:aspartyl-tRNA(Asn)/glutamyl-tRNA(Gln) amidotransferase subunit A
VPAALCGIVGWKPTAARVPIEGVLPLAPSLDSVGPLARSVACCALLDALMAGEEAPAPPGPPAPVAGLRLAVLQGLALEGLDATVAAAFQAALARLSAAGARITDLAVPELDEIPAANATGGFAASEAWAWHRGLIERRREAYDPRILARILRGERMSAADYIDLVAARRRIAAAVAPRTAPFDAVLMPTCPVIPPALAEVEEERAYNRINLSLLRNPSIGNFLDRCAISLPCHEPGTAPVGLMLMGERMGDARLFQVAAAVEAALRPGAA